ncbi:MAG: large conductance mechanosensitive channel protein MscL [Actinobacteria bacterium]|nr:large conductance mechanosensitive channel protein MscL [Actinomycetota bacterium]
MTEFREFLMRGNIVELAIAVVIATAFGALVASLITNLITPVIAAIFGQPDFSQLSFTINGSVFGYGSFINAMITFVSIAAAVFFFVVKPLQSMQRRRGIDPADTRSDELRVLEEIRELLRSSR